jgi:hypothetical protein
MKKFLTTCLVLFLTGTMALPGVSGLTVMAASIGEQEVTPATEVAPYAWQPAESERIALPLYADESWPTWRPGLPANFYEAIGIVIEEETERTGWFYAELPEGYTAKTAPAAPNMTTYTNELGYEVFHVYDHLDGPLISVGDRYRIFKEAELSTGVATVEWPYAIMSEPKQPKTVKARYTVVDVKTGEQMFATDWVDFTPEYHLPVGGEFFLEHFADDSNKVFDCARDKVYKFMENSGYWPQGDTDKTLADWGVK